jgi:hypothetical protein
MKQTNAGIEKLHAKSPRNAPEALPRARTVVFEPSQRPGRPPFVGLLNVRPTADWELFHAEDAAIAASRQKDHVELDVATGANWGCGVLFFGPERWRVPAGPAFATDLDGYSAIEIDANVPTSLTFALFVDEAGVGPPDSQQYDTAGGDDAESFVIGSNNGCGRRQTVRLELSRLEPRLDWGNQQGLRKVDLHAMKGISLYFYGGQGNHSLKLYSVKLIR